MSSVNKILFAQKYMVLQYVLTRITLNRCLGLHDSNVSINLNWLWSGLEIHSGSVQVVIVELVYIYLIVKNQGHSILTIVWNKGTLSVAHCLMN